MSNIESILDAAFDHIDENDVHSAVLRLQSAVSQHRVCKNARARCRVLTLGRFILIRDDEVVTLSKKSQRMPLELLKVVLSFGDKSASIQEITDLLWPDSEGDAAHAAFKVTLHRLRRLLGSPRAITVAHGTLSLNEAEVWVDAWAFERWFDSLPVTGACDESSHATAKRMLWLYKGTFLGSAAPVIAHPARERLRSKFVRAVLKLGLEYERGRNWSEAVQLYERGIDADALAEDIYQRLMLCHLELGQRGRALDVYRRCRTTLDAHLGSSPKMKTQSVYAAVCRAAGSINPDLQFGWRA